MKASDHKWKGIITSAYLKALLLEQLGSSLPTEEHNFNKFWIHVLKAYREFGKQIQVEKSEELVAYPFFSDDNIVVGNKTSIKKKILKKNVARQRCMFYPKKFSKKTVR